MKPRSILSLAAAALTFLPPLPSPGGAVDWSTLPPLPDDHGFAGPYAGMSGGALVVAGGANFPDGLPWDGGTKVWHDRVFALENPGADGSAWRVLEQRLPHPVGYGVSITLPERDAMIWIGGNDAAQCFADAWEVTYRDGSIAFTDLPPLPLPAAMACGAAIGNTIYVAGGAPDNTNDRALKQFVRLDLSAPKAEQKWEPLPWPDGAAGRILAVAGALGGKFYLIGGADLGSDDWPDKRAYLSDAWRFDPAAAAWERLADIRYEDPARGAVTQLAAAPTPALPAGQSHLLIFGGGAYRAFTEDPAVKDRGVDHPGFPPPIVAYHAITDSWAVQGAMPTGGGAFAPVTTPLVPWNGGAVIPSGEIKPGIRTTAAIVANPQPLRTGFGALNWVILAAYLLGMVGVGFWFARREKSTDDYFRGGGRVPWPVAGLSIFATMLSAITFMSIPAKSYADDCATYIGQLTMLAVVPLVIFFYLPYFRRLNITTAYEYLEQRFSVEARTFASASFILFHLGRVAIVLFLPAIALAQVSELNVYACIIVIGLLCILYTAVGGIEAVVWTDAVQAVVLLGGAALCLALAVHGAGGIGEVWSVARDNHKLLGSLDWASLDVEKGTRSGFVLLIAFFVLTLIPYTSGQDVVQRYVTVKDEAAARRSLWTTMVMSVFGSMLFFGLGVALYAFYKANPANLDPAMAQNDGILPFFVLRQLPAGVSGIIIAAIFAAAQSTISSSLNSVAAAWVTDFHKRLLGGGSDEHRSLAVARIVVVLLGLFGIGAACWIAASGAKQVFDQYQYVIGLTAGSLGGLFALGVFTKRANATGAIAGAAAGILAAFSAKQFSTLDGYLYGVCGFGACVLVGYLVSLADPNPAKTPPAE
ncbi:MAG: sodium/solute symporter [Verrucomicrobiales bacterium]